jgi:tetratricopeptide (TPR) repeat protein
MMILSSESRRTSLVVGAAAAPPPPREDANNATTTELAVLCLDFLQSVRKQSSSKHLTATSSSSYWTVACWALHRALSEETTHHDKENTTNHPNATTMTTTTTTTILPSISTMKMELEERATTTTFANNRKNESNDNENDDDEDEEEDDEFTNQRFYTTHGLSDRGLTFSEIVAAGVAGLHARSRQAAEREIVQSPLFHHYLQAVRAKGFFGGQNTEESAEQDHPDDEQQRYQKVVTKFRQKLCQKMESSSLQQQQQNGTTNSTATGELVAVAAADHQRRSTTITTNTTNTPSSQGMMMPTTMDNPLDLEEAEKLKNAGNVHMQKKEYEAAAHCYTDALKLCPAGTYSHVYYSNRAAALVSMKQFHQAILDSERALALQPEYGKAHARLGLAHFLLGDYRQAMEAYTVSLKYEPDNKSSRNYLEKSAKRLAEMGSSGSDHKNHPFHTAPSFSVVSEWDKKGNHHQNLHNNSFSSSQPPSSQPVSPEKQSSAKKVASSSSNHHPPDEREAERYKIKGNSLMASRSYAEAAEAYSKAIAFYPNGTQSHVYYSNRAAAYCYLERYEEAAQDSLQSLSLNPRYGKAYARLGLSRFFLHDYPGAIDAYTHALEYDPDNAASKSYLAKAQAKLYKQQKQQQQQQEEAR